MKSEQLVHLEEAAAAALSQGDWDEARRLYVAATTDEPFAAAFEGLGWAAWWTDDSDTVFAARQKAYQLYQEQGDLRGAARVALWLAMDYMDFRGEPAVASGWRQRARRLLNGLDLAAEHGWLAILEGEFMLLGRQDPVKAKRWAEEAVQIGCEVGVPDLEAIGLAQLGLALVEEGNVDPGMQCLDEAAVTVSSEDLHAPFSAGWVYCYVIYACEAVRDFDRAGQWCKRMEEVFERLRFRLFFGICRTHYAGVLMWQGAWHEAEAELLPATEHLEAARPPSAAEGFVRLGELRRRQGRLEEAEVFYMKAEGHPAALLGLGELALDRSAPKEAKGYVERLLRRIPGENGMQRVNALELLVRVEANLGNFDRGMEAAREVQRIAAAVGTFPFRAAASFSQGVIDAMSGKFEDARNSFEDAVDLYHQASAPFELAKARVELAKALLALNEPVHAHREALTAIETFGGLGAQHEIVMAQVVVSRSKKQSEDRPIASPERSAPLTSREIEVLGLIADGLSDKHIAVMLSISEHTVHRHVSNIFSKLGLSSRAAAVAHAARNDLL